MNLEHTIVGILGVAILAYLTYALVNPEKF